MEEKGWLGADAQSSTRRRQRQEPCCRTRSTTYRRRSQRASRDEQLFADSHDLNQLGRIAVEIDHIPGFFRSHRPGVHRNADIGLGQCRRVVCAVAGHRDQAAASLFLADVFQFVLRSCLCKEIIDTGFVRDGRGGKRVISRNHDGANSHCSERCKAFLHSTLDDVFEVNQPEDSCPVRNSQRRSTIPRDLFGQLHEFLRRRSTLLLHKVGDGFRRPFSQMPAVHIDAAHARVRGKRNEVRFMLANFAAAQAVFLFGKYDNRAALGSFVGHGSKLSAIRQIGFGDTWSGEKASCLPVAESNGAGFIEQKDINITRGLNGATGHSQHIMLHHSIHARDANCRKQAPDRGWDQTHEERDQHKDRLPRTRIDGEWL